MLFSVGDIINKKYKIIDWVGDGGFGEVYKTQDLTSDEIMAIKCLLPQLAAEQPELIKLFEKEAHAAMQAEHENVVKIFSIEEAYYKDSSIKFLTMEYTEDGDLDKFIKEQDTFLGQEELIEWMKQLLLGLKAVNAKLIHRDLKPSNILLCGRTLKISDFGLSRFIEDSTRTLTFKGAGTPLYMAPEVWENLSPTPLIDQYSMGLIFYVLATLRHPFLPIPSSENAYEFLRDKHLFNIPKQPKELNPELLKKLNSTIMKMIEKKPESRYQNLNDILNSLKNIQDIEQVEVPKEILEIAEIAKESEQKVKEEHLKKDKERKRQQDAGKKRKNIFDLHSRELIAVFEEVIDTINEQLEPSEIVKSKSSDEPFYRLMCSFQNAQLKVHLEQVNGVNEVENVIGWGYCYIQAYEDGFNLLLQQSTKSTYANWVVVTVRDNPVVPPAKHTKPHAMLELDELNKALRGLRMLSIYDAELKAFNKGMFLELVKKLVSQ